MKRVFLTLAGLGLAIMAQAQVQPNIELEVKSGKVVAYRSGYGTFTVDVQATTDNGVQRQLCYVTSSEQTLQLVDNSTVHSVRWDWLQGAVDSPVDTMFIYQLPYRGCRKAVVHALANYDLRIYRGNFRNFRVWQFDVLQGTKIFPMRAGEVIAVGEGCLTIEHSDGSQAQYTVLGENIMVQEGQQVSVKTQLGVAGEMDGKPMVRTALYHYVTNVSTIHGNMFSQTVYLDPLFKRGRLVDGKKY